MDLVGLILAAAFLIYVCLIWHIIAGLNMIFSKIMSKGATQASVVVYFAIAVVWTVGFYFAFVAK